ncbi:MAG: protein-L-isoaspartate(D-aspartate) O-methyltransferase [Chromatiales bacterium]|jgi:protein-L-isoaspartate(D-aspartate) O-methyltransferase
MSLPELAGKGMTSRRTRERMVERLREAGIASHDVLEALRVVPRHIFVDEALASRAYENTALPIGHGQTISQPYIVGRMTELLLEAGPLDTVLEIGTGSGYQTAVLAQLVRRVYTVERIDALIRLARQRFRALGLRNIRPMHSDGRLGLPQYAPFDGILAAAAPEGIPRGLVEQLKPGGRMVLPIGMRDEQVLVRVTRIGAGYDREILERVSFVPLIGGLD